MKEMTLEQFVEMFGLSEAGRRLGISHTAIRTAIMCGRDITLTIHADGTVTGTESRPFPSR